MQKNQIRIIGGQLKRRLLNFPDHEGLRPTSDRLRETLFNWLGQDLSDLSVLDLFAGSGALGFEAASRGAAHVLMIEKSAKVARALQENLALLGLTKIIALKNKDAVESAALLTAQIPKTPSFDIIFADPPFHQNLVNKILPYLPNLLKDEGFLYVESEMNVQINEDWQVIRELKMGQTFARLLQKTTHEIR